jgi:hypothetical protein
MERECKNLEFGREVNKAQSLRCEDLEKVYSEFRAGLKYEYMICMFVEEMSNIPQWKS